MQHIQIIRKLDYQNRITLPKQFTKALRLEPEDELNITFDKNIIQISSMKDHCIFCGNEATTLFEHKPICQKCIARLRNN